MTVTIGQCVTRNIILGTEGDSVVGHMLSMCEALASVPTSECHSHFPQ